LEGDAADWICQIISRISLFVPRHTRANNVI